VVHLTIRRRTLAIGLLATALTAIALPADAAGPSNVAAAQQGLAQAEQQARQASTALGAAQQQLAGAQAQLAAVRARVAGLDRTVTTDTARLAALDLEVSQDRTDLAAYVRSVYKSGGQEGALAYVVAASDIGEVFQRVAEMDRVDQAGKILLHRIADAQTAAHRALVDADAARGEAQAASQQAATAEAVVAIETAQLQTASVAANGHVTTAAHELSAAQAAAARQAAAEAAAAAAAAVAARNTGAIYTPVPGATFTIDTDLTRPSGETAATLNAFLSGSALAGLGVSFMNAEATEHVSARYFVAHAILESAWGTSAIAQNKHNLFGYGANDANPYGDAVSFSSFDACIQFVAQRVAQAYLSSSGAFYHGPTLRGMNVDYASDPLWASKIASIADTIPG
jgi:beta-N-acetylglucosaminidase